MKPAVSAHICPDQSYWRGSATYSCTFKDFLVEGGDLRREQRVDDVGTGDHHGGGDAVPCEGRGHLGADVAPADQDDLLMRMKQRSLI